MNVVHTHGALLTCAHYASLGPCTVTYDAVDGCQVVSLHRSRQHSSTDLHASVRKYVNHTNMMMSTDGYVTA